MAFTKHPRFSKRHYNEISVCLYKAISQGDDDDTQGLVRAARALGAMFKADNPRFQYDHFLDAAIPSHRFKLGE